MRAPNRGPYLRGVDPLLRFYSKVQDQPDGCKLWVGGVSPDGYGKFMVGPRGQQKTYRAHRWIWERLVGPISAGLYLRHRCDNPLCVHVGHLEPGTQADNIADMDRRGRRGRGYKQRTRFGERHQRARITEAAAREILARAAVGERHASIARAVGASPSIVYQIVRGRTWRHLSREAAP